MVPFFGFTFLRCALITDIVVGLLFRLSQIFLEYHSPYIHNDARFNVVIVTTTTSNYGAIISPFFSVTIALALEWFWNCIISNLAIHMDKRAT
jgi:hypothetical protein